MAASSTGNGRALKWGFLEVRKVHNDMLFYPVTQQFEDRPFRVRVREVRGRECVVNPFFPRRRDSGELLDVRHRATKNYVQYSIDEVIMISSLYDRVK